MLAFNRSDLERIFADTILTKAEDLAYESAVVEVNTELEGRSITGRVRGQRRTPYLTRIKIASGRGGRVRLSSTCTCLVYSECEHAAATLLHLLSESSTLDPEDASVVVEPELEAWINSVNSSVRNGAVQSEDAVLYLLEPSQRSWRDAGVAQPVSVHTVRAKRLRNNNFGRNRAIAIANLIGEPPQPYVELEDEVIGRMLGGANSQARRLATPADAIALEYMVATQRCFWRNSTGAALTIGKSRRGHFAWRFDGEGQQRLICELDRGHQEIVIVGLGEPWFIDVKAMECGRVETGTKPKVAGYLVKAPAIPPSAATIIRQRLIPSAEALPLPEPLRKRERVEIAPKPHLHLHCPLINVVRGVGYKKEEIELDVPVARVSFDYDGSEVSWQDSRSELNNVSNNRLLIIPRNALAEVQHIEKLNAMGLQPLGPTGLGRHAPEEIRQDFTFEEDEDDDTSMRWVEFNHYDIPKLLDAGWQVTFDESYPFQVLVEEPVWQIDVTDTGMEWFDFDLGIELDGERIPLLPILLDLFERAPEDMTPENLATYGEEPVYGTLPDGRLLAIPAVRLKAVVEALFEHFTSGRIEKDGTIKLRRTEATRLTLIDSTLGDGDAEWHGAESVLSLGHSLRQLTNIPEIAQPDTLKATLRPYQQQGLSWLQFLGKVGFSGVLADDMGLGKTLQTLSHLLTEKIEGRLTRPALVVVPTSLIPTWRAECRRFSPDLNMLILHGQNRSDQYKRITKSDIVLTSYALMLRDYDELIKRQYRVVILDEAQAIKNPGTKLAKAACTFKAEYRLALTGTPMENHLGELWSVFHFLMPGFLGERETFRRVFRQPIEKDADGARQNLLAQRVRPFLLRRTKEQVATELPPKSEFVRQIELTDAQRDLYETIRLAMHSRIREQIAQAGLGKSNIAVLEALLKLRQICCDPRLLKGDDASTAPSAKFDLLMDMLDGMVETGRRVIIFSQFVEMLSLMEEGLKERGHGYTMLTGRTRDRETPVKIFQAGDVPIFLISLKAGGTGLTLTRADTVIHYDPWWNPAVEAQATDRAHRIGQDKQVFVYRLVSNGTVEEKMLELQAKKKNLVDGILSGVGGKMSFSESDIENLFAPLPTG